MNWINVKDKLPKNQDTVLLWDEGEQILSTGYLHGKLSGFIADHCCFLEANKWAKIELPNEANSKDIAIRLAIDCLHADALHESAKQELIKTLKEALNDR